MHVLVAGHRGQLGGQLLDELARRGHDCVGIDRDEYDLTRPDQVRAAISAHSPDVVVNCAAYTAVDRAEDDVDAAYAVNAVAPRLLAQVCAQWRCHLVHISTDFVFAGDGQTPLDEWAPPRPLGVYAASKLAGEQEVRSLCTRHTVVRTSWLYGRQGPNFVLTMLRLARERGALRVVGDQHGCPTWTGHLAPALVTVFEQEILGTVHLSNAGVTTWHGFAEAIVAGAGLQVPVEAITTADYPTPARRPAYSALDNRAWRLLGLPPLPAWQEGLAAYLREIGEGT